LKWLPNLDPSLVSWTKQKNKIKIAHVKIYPTHYSKTNQKKTRKNCSPKKTILIQICYLANFDDQKIVGKYWEKRGQI